MTTEPTTPPEELILSVRLDDGVVGSVVRPPRPITHGPRTSDRWLAWSIVGTLGLLSGFAVYVGWRVEALIAWLRSRSN